MPLLASLFLAGIVTSTFAGTYTDNGDGTVTDPTTGLTWMRCSMGMAWTGTTCAGYAKDYFGSTQVTALTTTFAGHSDWRMANIRELQTIVDRSRYGALDQAAFPGSQGGNFWSATPDARIGGQRL